MRLLVEFSFDRDRSGVLALFDARGRKVAGPFAVAGRAHDDLAQAHGNPHRDSVFPYGDTPAGAYRVREILKSGSGTQFPAAEFGSHGVVVLEGIAGDAALAEANGRFHVLIQGGKPGKSGALRATAGALRLSDADLKVLVAALRKHGDGARCDVEVRGTVAKAQAIAVSEAPALVDPPLNSVGTRAPTLTNIHLSRRGALRAGAAGATVTALSLSVSFVAFTAPSPARAQTRFAYNEPPETPPAEEPPPETPPAETPPAEEPPAESPPAEVPPAEEPPAETPPAEEPPAETPPAETPPAETPTAPPPAEAPPPAGGYGIQGLPGVYTGGPNGGGGETPPASPPPPPAEAAPSGEGQGSQTDEGGSSQPATPESQPPSDQTPPEQQPPPPPEQAPPQQEQPPAEQPAPAQPSSTPPPDNGGAGGQQGVQLNPGARPLPPDQNQPQQAPNSALQQLKNATSGNQTTGTTFDNGAGPSDATPGGGGAAPPTPTASPASPEPPASSAPSEESPPPPPSSTPTFAPRPAPPSPAPQPLYTPPPASPPPAPVQSAPAPARRTITVIDIFPTGPTPKPGQKPPGQN